MTVGRLQIFNNWSPWLVSSPDKVWIGLEYFCNETDASGSSPMRRWHGFAVEEIARIGILKAEDVEDSHVVRVPKTYPAYFGSYDRFDVIRRYIDGFENLFLVGRNGMHKYNNQDHSMLTAMTAVENIVNGVVDQGQHLGDQHRDGVPRRKDGKKRRKRAQRDGNEAEKCGLPGDSALCVSSHLAHLRPSNAGLFCGTDAT